MELLGDRNWWLPHWLDRLFPRVSIEARPREVSVAPANGNVTRPIGYWLRQADLAIAAQYDEVLEDNGLTRLHWQTLNVVRRSETATRRAVQQALGAFADRTELNEALDELVETGWIVRRRQGYAVTDEGMEGYRDIRRFVADVPRQAAAGIGDKDYSTTVATLERIVHNLSGNGASGASR
jgi:DNA-binding MarR family transcriptional regulator